MRHTMIDQSFDIQVLECLATKISPLELKGARCKRLIDGLNASAEGRFAIVGIDHRRNGCYSLRVRVFDSAIVPQIRGITNIEIIS